MGTTSQQVCFICGYRPTDRSGDPNRIRDRPIKEEHLAYGMSTLHAWIRSCSAIFKLGTMLPLQKATVRGSADEAVVRDRKLHLITRRSTPENHLLVQEFSFHDCR